MPIASELASSSLDRHSYQARSSYYYNTPLSLSWNPTNNYRLLKQAFLLVQAQREKPAINNRSACIVFGVPILQLLAGRGAAKGVAATRKVATQAVLEESDDKVRNS